MQVAWWPTHSTHGLPLLWFRILPANATTAATVNFDLPPATEPGHAGKGLALVFDRQRQQRIDVESGAQQSLDLPAFTIAAWIRITESDTAERELGDCRKKAAAYWLNVRNGHDSVSTAYRLRCGLMINGVQFSVDSSIKVPHDGRWVHVAGSFNGTSLRVYINGVLRGSRAVSGRVDMNDFPWRWVPTTSPIRCLTIPSTTG